MNTLVIPRGLVADGDIFNSQWSARVSLLTSGNGHDNYSTLKVSNTGINQKRQSTPSGSCRETLLTAGYLMRRFQRHKRLK